MDSVTAGRTPARARHEASEPVRDAAVVIRAMTAEDWPQVRAIYQAGIDAGDATFETSAPDWERFDAGKLPAHRWVAVDRVGGAVLGWVAVSAVSGRPAYRGVVEDSVYVRPDAMGRGIGSALLGRLIASTEAAGIWTLQSAIFPENTASLALHARAGFRTVGVRRRIARHRGVWRDTVLIERRSDAG
jgi:phosphinothricin acetyltransferase